MTRPRKTYAKDLIGEFVKQIMQGAMVVSKDTELMINARIAQLDRLISQQLNEVMHHPDFQKLEASWRGLHYLVHQSETGEMMKIKVMNVSKKDLLKDMEKATEFDQSTLFKKIYEEEFGMFGGAALAPSWVIMNSVTTLKTWPFWKKWRGLRPRRMRLLSLQRHRRSLTSTASQSLERRETLRKSSRAWSMRSGSLSAIPKTPDTSLWPFLTS